jgi:hypothetical protein
VRGTVKIYGVTREAFEKAERGETGRPVVEFYFKFGPGKIC